MTEVPDFLLELGLRPDADERAIKRAYAVELKKIDQETQAQQFQRLRGAYEAALYWVRNAREAQEEVETTRDDGLPAPALAAANAETAERTTTPGPEPVSAPSTAPAVNRNDEPPPPHCGDPAMPRHDSVRDILVALNTRLQEDPLQTVHEAASLLEITLEDPRLLDMDARFLFEANIAHLLACGWRPGHEHLFEAALNAFEWRTDSARLLRLGQAGHVVDRAIVEQDAQAQQPPAQRDSQLHFVALLRHRDNPGPQALALGMGPVMHAATAYPTWLRLTSNTAHIESWQRHDADIARSTVQSQPSATNMHSGSLNASRLTVWFAIFFVGILALAALGSMLKEGTGRTAVAPPSTPSPSSAALEWPQGPRPAPSSRFSELPQDPSAANAQARAFALQAAIAGSRGVQSTRPGSPEPEPPAAEYTSPPHVIYPVMSKRLGEQGRVVLRIAVNSTGSVGDATVLRSSGFERLDAAAIDAVRTARVVPMKSAEGHAVAAWYKASINFVLNDAVSKPTTSPAVDRRPSYGETVTAAVRPNILFSKDVPGNPLVEYTLDLSADGRIIAAQLSRPSGVPEWDAAALRAIHKTGRMPLTEQGTVPSKMVLALRPKVQ